MRDLKAGEYVFIVVDGSDVSKHRAYCIPTSKGYANGRVLKIDGDTALIHWIENYNRFGDFSSELMRFDVRPVCNRGGHLIVNESNK